MPMGEVMGELRKTESGVFQKVSRLRWQIARPEDRFVEQQPFKHQPPLYWIRVDWRAAHRGAEGGKD